MFKQKIIVNPPPIKRLNPFFNASLRPWILCHPNLFAKNNFIIAPEIIIELIRKLIRTAITFPEYKFSECFFKQI